MTARDSPITAKRFEQQRWNTARRSGLMNATGLQLARSLFYAWNMGWEPAVLDDYPRDLASVTGRGRHGGARRLPEERGDLGARPRPERGQRINREDSAL